jgi:opacity protein-like surface antigen
LPQATNPDSEPDIALAALSLKAEYLYVDLGTFSYYSPLVASVAAAAPGYSWRTSVTERDHIVRVGLNYKFGPAPLVAKY